MGIKPLFTSAPRCKLKLGSDYIAYAIGFNVSVSVDITPVHVLGKIGAVSLEPTFYNPVTGTIQIQKLLSKFGRTNLTNSAETFKTNASSFGDLKSTGVDTVNNTESYSVSKEDSAAIATAYSAGDNWISGANISKHLDPNKVLTSETFDLDVYLRAGSDSLSEKAWLRIKDVRLTTRNVNITLGQIVNEPVSFQGLLITPNFNGELFARDYGRTEGS